VILAVHRDIEAGVSFCDALAKHPAVFSELFLSMVKAGEVAGMLDEILDRLAIYLEKSAALNRKIKSSLVYPSVVVTMAIAITVFLLVKVVPTFKNIFEMLGGQLPLPTALLLKLSDMLRSYFLFLLGLTVAAVFVFKRYIATKQGRYRFDDFKLRMAVFGPLLRKVALAKFSRTFSTLIKSGVPILNGLEIVAKTAGNKIIEETIVDCRRVVRQGESLSQPLAKSGVFPVMVCRMISVGEKTGQLEKMLSKIADFYEEQVDAAVAALTSLIEPLVIVFLGVVIGGIVISLFLPILKITELIGR
jgi:type IV pilus assembly protein PilC